MNNRLSNHNAPTAARTQLHLWILVFWHLSMMLVMAGGVVYLWGAEPDILQWLVFVLTALLLLGAAGSGLASYYLWRHNRRGRNLSLIVNYLVAVAALLIWLQVFEIYHGIDSLANTFGQGLPFLLLVLIGYIVSSLSGRAEGTPGRARFLRLAAKYIALVGIVFFLFAVGIVPALVAFAGRLVNPLGLGLSLLLVVLSILIWLGWRTSTASAVGARNSDQEMLYGLLFLSPNLLGFLLFFAGPLLLSLYVSFTDWDAFGTRNWIGLANYGKIFNLTAERLANAGQLAREVIDITVFDELARFSILGQHFVIGAADKLFWTALRNTIVFVLLAVPFSVLPALLLANVLNTKIRGMQVFRAVYFVPTIAAVVGVALIWRWLYNTTVGWINYAIATGVDLINGIAGAELLTNPEIGWLSDTRVALIAVVIIASWQWLGFNTVLFLAGLQGIPKTLYEAATVDGAGSMVKFLRVTVPLLAPTTFFVITTTTIQAMQIFDQVFILTTPPGGPGTSTTTIVLYLYQSGFRQFRQGYASAIAWVLFLLIFAFTLFQFQRQRTAEGAG